MNSRTRWTADATGTSSLTSALKPRELAVVGAHYDAFGSFPGGDDNASGVPGLIELAGLLSTAQLTSRVQLVTYRKEDA